VKREERFLKSNNELSIYLILQEVFKSDVHIAMPLDQVLGLCCVLSVKDYFRSKPEGFADKDVYVCESRYSTKARAFKKIKVGL
jgi:protein polybromo-1